MLRYSVSTAWLFFVALLFASPALNAQLSTRATITGTVTDATGAVMPGAKVTITDDATKVATQAETNKEGAYNVSGLTVSTYSITIAKNGFKSYEVTGIELHPTETVQVNGSLSIGTTAETVTVHATSTDVELSTPENSAYISGEQVSSLPMNGRNYSAVLAGLPGIQNLSNGSALTTGGRSTNDSLSINGMATSRSFYAVDGIWNENTGNMTQQSVIPNPDSIEEVRVLQNNFSAQYSLLGSSVITDADQERHPEPSRHRVGVSPQRRPEREELLLSLTIPPYKQNIFGFNVGGPVFIPACLQHEPSEDLLLLGRVLRGPACAQPDHQPDSHTQPDRRLLHLANQGPRDRLALPDSFHLQWQLPAPSTRSQRRGSMRVPRRTCKTLYPAPNYAPLAARTITSTTRR